MTRVEEESRLMIVPAEAVIQRGQVLFNRTRCKGQVGGNWNDLRESYPKRGKESKGTGFLESERGIRNGFGTSEMG